MSLLVTFARAALALGAELVAPSTCAACDAPVGLRVLFCRACASTAERFGGTEPCLAPFTYGGAVATAIARLKYAQRPDLAPRLGEVVAAHVRHVVVDLVVPVPIHPRRLVARGFDQASLLAAPVARGLRRPREPRLLRRTVDTPAQVGRSREARLENVAGAFACRAPARVRGRIVLLVDDVVTTGATMAACTDALLRAGAARVFTAAVAVRVDRI